MNCRIKSTEQLARVLRSLYADYGYSHFKMSKFEQYDLYAANKDFLASDSIITFTDRSGRLLALKPDVTLSIIKNSKEGKTSKYYYNENVYRIRRGSDTYSELLQLGVECIGRIGAYETAEMLIMAIKSLRAISERYVLDVSSMALVGEVLGGYSLTDVQRQGIFKCMAEKSAHGVDALGLDASLASDIKTLITTEGELAASVLELGERIPRIAKTNAFCELCELADIFPPLGYSESVRLDFSVVHDRTYYNGIVMRGFIDGVPERVLSGGRYDLLLRRMGKDGGGIGFSVYADALEQLFSAESAQKAEVLVLASPADDPKLLIGAGEALRASGITVSVAASADGIEYRRLMKLCGDTLTEVTE